MLVNSRIFIIGMVVAVAACSNSQLRRAVEGPAVDLTTKQVKDYRENADQVLLELAMLSGQTGEDSSSLSDNADFGQVASAGFLIVDVACDEYLTALFWLDRGRTHTATQLDLTNTAAAGALGIFGASANAIALVAGAFGLTAATVENISDSLLYQLEPALLRDLVRKTQVSFLNSVNRSQINTRISALWHIAAYANLCKPASIETEVARSLNASRPTSADVTLDGAPPVSGLTNEQVRFSGATTSADEAVRNALNNFIERDGVEFRRQVQSLLTEQGRDLDVINESGALFELLIRPSESAFRAELLARLAM